MPVFYVVLEHIAHEIKMCQSISDRPEAVHEIDLNKAIFFARQTSKMAIGNKKYHSDVATHL